MHTLTVGVDGWAMHEPLRAGDRRGAALLDRAEAVTDHALRCTSWTIRRHPEDMPRLLLRSGSRGSAPGVISG